MTEPQFTEKEAEDLKKWAQTLADYAGTRRLIKIVGGYAAAAAVFWTTMKEPIMRFLGMDQ